MQNRHEDRGFNFMTKRHWKSRTWEYSSWCSMKYRCLNKNGHVYHRYWWRWIQICERWMIFQNFYDDMWPRPQWMSIDRIDNNGDYEPWNCRWATRKEQQNNLSNNVYCIFDGQKMPYVDFATICKLSKTRLRYMMYDGMSGDQIVSHLIKIRGKRIRKRVINKINNTIFIEIPKPTSIQKAYQNMMPLEYCISCSKRTFILK